MQHGVYGQKEGLVVGSHIDYAVRVPVPCCPPPLTRPVTPQGRQIVEVQLEPGSVYNAWCACVLLRTPGS